MISEFYRKNKDIINPIIALCVICALSFGGYYYINKTKELSTTLEPELVITVLPNDLPPQEFNGDEVTLDTFRITNKVQQEYDLMNNFWLSPEARSMVDERIKSLMRFDGYACGDYITIGRIAFTDKYGESYEVSDEEYTKIHQAVCDAILTVKGGTK